VNAVKQLYRVENGKLHLDLHSGQSQGWLSRARFVFVVAGSQSGKTSFGPFWLEREIYGGEYEPGITFPGCGPGDYLAVTANYDLFKLKMLPAMLEVFERLLGLGRYWAGDGVIELKDPKTGEFWARRSTDPMWGRIILRSAMAEGGLESTTANAAWLDECGQDKFRLSSWEAVRRRLSLKQGRVLGTTTPYNLGWLKTEIVDPWNNGDKDIDVIQFASIVNPAFPEAEFLERKAKMASWKFQMFYLGEFSRPAGLIYGDFDEQKHLVEPFQIPPEWPRVVGIDFGPVHTATLWIAHDTEHNKFFAYRESLEGDKTTNEHGAQIKAWGINDVGSERYSRILFFGGAPSEIQERRDWKAAGVPIRQPLISGVESGIDRVISLFKTNQLYVFRALRQTRESLRIYSREVDERGDPTEKIKNKQDFHLLDCLRYAGIVLVRKKAGALWL